LEHKVLRVATILGVPGFALAVMYLLLRSFGFSFATIDPLMSGAIAIVFLLIVGGITSFALHLWRPQRPSTTDMSFAESNKPSSAANYVQLGYDLRYISTLQTFMPEKASKSELDIKTLARSLNLKVHGMQRGDELVSYYFDQIGLPLRRDAFNLGFFLAQIEVGRMIASAAADNSETLELITSGMTQATRNLREKLQGFGASDLLHGFPTQPTEAQVGELKSEIKNRLREVEV